MRDEIRQRDHLCYKQFPKDNNVAGNINIYFRGRVTSYGKTFFLQFLHHTKLFCQAR